MNGEIIELCIVGAWLLVPVVLELWTMWIEAKERKVGKKNPGDELPGLEVAA